MEIDLNQRYRTMLTLWAALLMSVFLYFMVTLLAAPAMDNEAERSAVPILVLSTLGLLLFLISFPVKQRVLKQSIEKQDVGLVQKAMIIACAMSEVSAVFGLVLRFLGLRGYYSLFLLAAVGMLCHFPRRRDLEAAQWRTIKSSILVE